MGIMNPEFYRAQIKAATGKDPGSAVFDPSMSELLFQRTPAVKPAPPLPVVDTTQPAAAPESAAAETSEYTQALRNLVASQIENYNSQYDTANSAIGMHAARLQNAANVGMQANAEQAGIVKKYAMAEADIHGQQAQVAKVQNTEDDASERQHSQEVAAARKRAEMASDVATSAEVKDFWHDKSTGSRILGVLAQTLAGAANGLAGTPGAPSALDRIIDHDFEVQKSNIANKRDAAYRAEGALSQLVNTYKDEREGKLAARAAAYKMVDLKLKQLGAQMKGEIAPAASESASAATQAKIEESLMEVERYKAQNAAVAGANATDAGVKLSAQESIAKQLAAQQDRRHIEIPGLVGTYDRELLSAESRQKLSSFSEAMNNLDGYERDLIHDDKAFRAYAGTITGNALTEGAIRKILGTGAALNAAELKAVQSFTMDFLKGQSLSSLSSGLRTEFFQGVRRALARSYGGFIRGTIPNAKFDMNHATFGRANHIIAEDDAQAATK